MRSRTTRPTRRPRCGARRHGSAWAPEQWDFDLGGTLFDGKTVKVVDVGDVPGEARDLSGHYRRAEQAIRKILEAGALPVTIGGDHGVPIPIFRALDGHGPVTLVHLDAHLDWRDERYGVREGYSSPIRRAAEMDHFGDIFQLGIRGQGSARREDVEAARRYGAHIITAQELHRDGRRRAPRSASPTGPLLHTRSTPTGSIRRSSRR